MSLKFNSVVSRSFQKGKRDELCITHCRVEGSMPRHQEEQFFSEHLFLSLWLLIQQNNWESHSNFTISCRSFSQLKKKSIEHPVCARHCTKTDHTKMSKKYTGSAVFYYILWSELIVIIINIHWPAGMCLAPKCIHVLTFILRTSYCTVISLFYN